MALMEPNSIAIIPSAGSSCAAAIPNTRFARTVISITSADLPEPDAVLVLAPGRRHGQFVMFCRERDPAMELWHGYRAGPEGL